MLNYPFTDRTRLRVRIEVREISPYIPGKVLWLSHLTSTEDCQRAYLAARNATDLGASQFRGGEVFDEAGQHIANISYNGRLWPAVPWTPGMEPLADAPA